MAQRTVGQLIFELVAEGDKFAKQIDGASEKITGIATAATVAGGAVAAAGTAMMAATTGVAVAAVSAASTFEDSFANVKKTVGDLNDGELKELRAELLKLSAQQPLDPNQLAGITALGGQLGVAGPKLLDFTRTMSQLGVAIDGIEPETAAQQLAQLANVMRNNGADNFAAVASSLVELGNTSATTEGMILSMTSRISGAFAAIGGNVDTALGLSAALSSLGVQSELGGTALSKFLVDLNMQVSKGGEKLETYAKIAGTTAEEFKKAWAEDTDAAIRQFFSGLSSQGGNATDLLQELGIKGARAQRVFLSLANSGDLVTRSFKSSSDAFKSQNAHIEEARRKWDTLSNKWKTLKNIITTQVLIPLGDSLLPILKKVIEILTPMATKLGEWAQAFAKAPTPIKAVGVALMGIITAMGAALAVGGSLALMAVGLAPGFLAAKPAILASTGALGGFAASAKAAVVAIAPIVGTVLAVAAAFAVGLKAGEGIRYLIDTYFPEFGKAIDTAMKQYVEWWDLVSGRTQAISDEKNARDAQIAKARAYAKQLEAVAKANGTWVDLSKQATAATEEQAEVTDEAAKAAEEYAKKIQDLAKEMGGGGLKTKMQELSDAVALGGSLTESAVKDITETVQKALAAGFEVPENLLAISVGETMKRVQKIMQQNARDLKDAVVDPWSFGSASSIGTGGDTSGLRDMLGKRQDNFDKWWAEQDRILAEQKKHYDDLRSAAMDWGEALDSVRNVMEVMGLSADSLFGKLVGGAASVLSSIQNMQGAFKSLSAVKELRAAGQQGGGLFSLLGAGLGAASSVAGVAMTAVKFISNLFGSSPAQKAAKHAGRQLGVAVSEGMGESIANLAEELGVGTFEATLLSIVDIAADSKVPLSTMASGIDDLMNAVKLGKIPLEEGAEAIGKVFTALGDEGTLKAASEQLDMIFRTRELGLKIPEIQEAVNAGLAKATEGLGMIDFAALGVGASEAGMIFGDTFWATVAEQGLFTAVEAMQPVWDQLTEQFGETFGADGALGAIPELFGLMQGELAPIFESMQGIDMALAGLADAGYLSAGSFSAMQTSLTAAFDSAVAGGASSEAAMAAIVPTLARMQAEAERYGYELDDATLALIEQAEAMGYAFPEDPMMAMVDLLGQIVQLLGGEVPAAAAAAGRAISAIPKPDFGGLGGGGLDESGIPGYAKGGLVEEPTLAWVAEDEPELIIPMSALESGAASAAPGADLSEALDLGAGGGSPTKVNVYLGTKLIYEELFEASRTGDLRMARTAVVD